MRTRLVTFSSSPRSGDDNPGSASTFRRAGRARAKVSAVWQEMQNVLWSRAAGCHPIHHVNRPSRYAAAVSPFQVAASAPRRVIAKPILSVKTKKKVRMLIKGALQTRLTDGVV